MKSPNERTSGAQSKPEHPRPMSCRGSALQRAMSDAIRKAAPSVPVIPQDWRVKDVISGKTPACVMLEAAIDNRIAAGASEESVMQIAYALVSETRRKLMEARPAYAAIIRDLDLALIHETQAQGPADVAQMDTLKQKCANGLRNLLNRLTGHRDAIDIAIDATEHELRAREGGRNSTLTSFGITPTGRAS